MNSTIPMYRVRDTAQPPDLKPFKCPTCKQSLGETNGTSLRIGMAAFPFVVTFTCLWCGGVVKWKPVNGSTS
jgi:RNase P subunit RPR2